MATGSVGGLLRGPGQPRVAFLELFLDLVFVFALFRLSQDLLAHLSWIGALQTLMLLLPVLYIWFSAARFTGLFDPRHPLIELLIISIMFGTLVVAATTPEAFGRKGLLFAGAYVTLRLGAGTAVILLLHDQEAQLNAARILFWAGVSAVPWIAGAFLHGWGRAALWIPAAVVEYAMTSIGYPTPRLGRSNASRAELVTSEEHLAERYQQFFIIALGEPILVTGLAFANGNFGAARSAATLAGFITTALLWRIYIHRAGTMLAQAITASHNLRRLAVLTIYAHVVMVAGVITISVGDELVIHHPLGQTQPAWIAVFLGGPALFLAGRATFEYAVFGRVSRLRVIGALVLVAITPAMRLVPPLAVASIAAITLAGVAVADAARTRRFPSEAPSPPG